MTTFPRTLQCHCKTMLIIACPEDDDADADDKAHLLAECLDAHFQLVVPAVVVILVIIPVTGDSGPHSLVLHDGLRVSEMNC